ncbi:MAG: TAXI family TRAP transporter solute-binding subunit, partial [Planctomycetota bacterium]
MQHRAVSLKFTTKGRCGPVLSMEAVDSRGELTWHHNVPTYLRPGADQISPQRECRWEYVRDPNGQIVCEKAYDKDGKFVWALVYSPLVGEDPNKRNAHYIGPDLYPMPLVNSTADFVSFEYSTQGDEIYVRYFDRQHNPVTGPDNTFGRKQKFDKRGLRAEITPLGIDGKPIYDERGSATFETRRYDQLGNVEEVIALDTSGELTITKDGWAKYRAEYNSNGSITEWAYYDEEGKPTLHRDGYYRATASYDDRGNTKELAYYDEEDKPTLHKAGYHMAAAKHDDRGNVTEWAYCDRQGKPTLHKDGYHRVTTAYDKRGNTTKWAYYDIHGQPTLDASDGTHIATGRYDGRGNRTEFAYFDRKGKPTLHKDGYHRATVKYDDRGNMTGWARRDEEGQLIDSAGSAGSVTIGTGEVMGIYYPSGGAISEMVNKESDQYGITATIKSTGGSVYNINAVLNGELDCGIVQSDRQYQAYNGEAEWSWAGRQKDLRAVFSIHPESITLIASAESGITSVADLRGKRVNIGSPGSGQLHNAKHVLSAFGIDLNSIEGKDLDVAAARQ